MSTPIFLTCIIVSISIMVHVYVCTSRGTVVYVPVFMSLKVFGIDGLFLHAVSTISTLHCFSGLCYFCWHGIKAFW